MARLYNLRSRRQARRNLRTKGTPAEAVLWTRLQRRQLDGRRFRRQHSVGPYVLDFYCPAERLAIELDGDGHFAPGAYEVDARRDRYLESVGIRVVRIENRALWEDLEGVIEYIRSSFTSATD